MVRPIRLFVTIWFCVIFDFANAKFICRFIFAAIIAISDSKCAYTVLYLLARLVALCWDPVFRSSLR
jgi:hypothetical protein